MCVTQTNQGLDDYSIGVNIITPVFVPNLNNLLIKGFPNEKARGWPWWNSIIKNGGYIIVCMDQTDVVGLTIILPVVHQKKEEMDEGETSSQNDNYCVEFLKPTVVKSHALEKLIVNSLSQQAQNTAREINWKAKLFTSYEEWGKLLE